jgi:hypothetical protein
VARVEARRAALAASQPVLAAVVSTPHPYLSLWASNGLTFPPSFYRERERETEGRNVGVFGTIDLVFLCVREREERREKRKETAFYPSLSLSLSLPSPVGFLIHTTEEPLEKECVFVKALMKRERLTNGGKKKEEGAKEEGRKFQD